MPSARPPPTETSLRHGKDANSSRPRQVRSALPSRREMRAGSGCVSGRRLLVCSQPPTREGPTVSLTFFSQRKSEQNTDRSSNREILELTFD